MFLNIIVGFAITNNNSDNNYDDYKKTIYLLSKLTTNLCEGTFFCTTFIKLFRGVYNLIILKIALSRTHQIVTKIEL